MAAEAKVRITTDTRGVQTGAAKVKREFASLKTSAMSLGKAIAGAFVVREMVRFGAGAFKAAASFDTMKRSLAAVIKEGEDVNKVIEDLRDLAGSPGLTFDTVADAAVRLRAVGFGAEETKNIIKEFGNALAVVGKGQELDGVALALGQIASKGKVSAEEINQIAERLPQVRMAMQDAFGTADTEVLQKRGIGAKEFVNAVTEALSKGARATAGYQDQINKLSQAMTDLKVTIGQTFAPAVARQIENITLAIREMNKEGSNAKKTAAGGKTAYEVFKNVNPVLRLYEMLGEKAGDFLLPVGEFADVEKRSSQIPKRGPLPGIETDEETRARLGLPSAEQQRKARLADEADPFAGGQGTAGLPAAVRIAAMVAKRAISAGDLTETVESFAPGQASSLARIGGGGGVGQSQVTRRLDKHTKLLEDIKNNTADRLTLGLE